MNDKQTLTQLATPDFESIKHFDDQGAEFWLARELYKVLGYTRWEGFQKPLSRAKESCRKSNNPVENHFHHLTKMVSLGYGTERKIEDVALSRYACYLIVQNSDPSKPVIAAGQTYFAIQTRRQELSDQEKFEHLSDDEKRIYLRHELKEHNKRLSSAAHDAGVVEPKDYAIFQNYGYRGLYGGLSAKEIHARKKLKKSHDILDFMGHEELAANLFRATQTEAKLRRDHIQGKPQANQTHYDVGRAVRQTIKNLGGTMPEDLPTPRKSIKQLELEEKKRLAVANQKSAP